MEIFSALLALCEGNPSSPVDSPHKGQCFLWSAPEQTVEQTMETGDLKRYGDHCEDPGWTVAIDPNIS